MKKKALAVVLTLMMVVSILPMAAFAADFSDVSADFWARDAINRWTDEGILQGVGDNKFAPNDTLTRAQAAAIFTRLLQLTDTADVSNFTDVEADSWYASYVACAVAAGIMNGTSATTFNPNGTITRQDFFLILARAVGIKEQSTCNYTQFNDLNQLSGYARGSVYALINLDYVHGRSATELAPLAPITRASAAQVLDNVIQYYITEDGSYDVSGNGVALILAKNVALNGNFSGTVVGSAEDSVVDLTGVTQPVTAIANKDNVKFINAQPQSAVYSNAPGTEVNGTSVPEGTSYTVPSTQPTPIVATGGGGGGGGYETYYDSQVSINLGGFVSHPIILNSSIKAASTPTLDEAFEELAGLTDTTNGKDNYDVLYDGMNQFLNKCSGTSTSTIGVDTYKVTMAKDGNTVAITILKNGTELTAAEYQKVIEDLDTIFNSRSNGWSDFTSTFAPSKQIHVDGGRLHTYNAEEYVLQLQAAVKALNNFRSAQGSSYSYTTMFSGDGAILKLDNADMISSVLQSTTLPQVASILGGLPVVIMDEDTSGATSFSAFMGHVVDRSVVDYTAANPAAQAVWEAAYNNGSVLGQFSVSFSVVKAEH